MPEAPWWKRGVVYQIAVSSFADANGDGRGDLRGIIERLDYLNDGTDASLGIDAIWLTPIYTSPLSDFGYDVSDYRSIDPRFGTMEDFDELVSECHRRGIRVVMDLVLNHTSIHHPWFVESRSSRDNPRRDWYIWRDGRSPGKPPNSWVAVVEGSAWEYDSATGQYYYHAFLPFQPDLNWRNPEVREEMFGVTRFWLAKGVDGFRLDLVNCLYEDEELRNNPPRLGPRPYLAQKHIHDLSQPENLEVAAELRRLVEDFGDCVLMGEVLTLTPDVCIDYLGDGTDRLHLSFYMEFVRTKWNAEAFRRSVRWLEEHVPPGGWPCYYLNNHDLKRSFTRLGGRYPRERAKVAAAMLLTLRGTPILYYGEEIGMPSSRVPRGLLDDPVGLKFWPLRVGRDGSRTPMHWSASENAGFSAWESWLPVDSSYRTRNVEHESGRPDSILNWYRQLLGARKVHPALHSGDYHEIDGVPKGVFAYTRQAGSEQVAVYLNFTARALECPPPPESRAWRVLLSTHGTEEAQDLSRIRLAANEALLLEAVYS
ncbi:MAG: glucohydrolase [Actinobacteria bacterium HGW-Actinobacteria-1]|jgi:alpha-glucosidase|nr:MAG: glucohydrolase [Actinobacteria bacterium HGW-Actinobacteria-1]